MTLDDENKKEPVLNVRIVEEPVYGANLFDKEDVWMTTLTQSQKIEILLRYIGYYLIFIGFAIIALLCFFIWAYMQGYEFINTIQQV
jgi:hypothetical protein